MPDGLDTPWLLGVAVAAALLFSFTNGWNDAPAAMTTVVSARVLTPAQALILGGAGNLAGAFWGEALARTVATGIVMPGQMSLAAVAAAAVGVLVWNLVVARRGLPFSASHALVGALLGAGLAHAGWTGISAGGLKLVLAAMLLSPLLGGVLAYAVMKLCLVVFGGSSPSTVNKLFRSAQVASSALLHMAHGSNDGQKAIGLAVLALAVAGAGSVAGAGTGVGGGAAPFVIAPWVRMAVALALAAGTLVGGWRALRPMGMRVLRLQPIQGFSAEAGAAAVLAVAASQGVPVSTTHTTVGSLLGAGGAARASAVQWSLANKMVYAWVVTIPGAAAVAFLVYRVFHLLG